jgi:hypothetical protein
MDNKFESAKVGASEEKQEQKNNTLLEQGGENQTQAREYKKDELMHITLDFDKQEVIYYVQDDVTPKQYTFPMMEVLVDNIGDDMAKFVYLHLIVEREMMLSRPELEGVVTLFDKAVMRFMGYLAYAFFEKHSKEILAGEALYSQEEAEILGDVEDKLGDIKEFLVEVHQFVSEFLSKLESE